MLVKNEEQEVDVSDPWQDDRLDRKKAADYLTPVIETVTQPFVIGLKSKYGTGKTYFIKRWMQDLANAGAQTAYFNAWETDFTHDALSAFIAALQRQLAADDSDTGNKFKQLAQKSGAFVKSKALPILLKGLGQKLVGAEGVEEIIGELGFTGEELAEVLSSSAVEALQSQNDAEEAVVDFRAYLEELISSILDGTDEDNANKLIIFVDELDRCRPTYAIEVLECIKHLFNVPGVMFILAIDEDQLKSVVKSIYGADIDAVGYLQRFIDWSFALPSPPARAFALALSEKFGLNTLEGFREKREEIVRAFSSVCEGYGLSLRQQEQAFTQLNLAIRYINSKHIAFGVMLGFLSALRAADYKAYNAIPENEAPHVLAAEIRRKLEKTECDIPFGRRWDDFENIIHAWLTSEENYHEVELQISQAQRQIEHLQSESKEVSNDNHNVKTLRKYQRISDVYHSYVGYGLWKSPAHTTVDVIEGAAAFE